jgi:polyisoprenoid-binding protein YceI
MKWLVPAAMAVFAIGSCSQGDKELLSEPSAAVDAEVARGDAEDAAPASATSEASIDGIPAGDYKLDPSHASLLFTVNHLGFSNYTASFGRFTADLKLDPADPAAAVLNATVDPASLQLINAPGGFLEELKGDQWIDTSGFPQITFKSTHVAVTGKNTADVTGDLTLHGVTKPVKLEMTYNGGYAGHVYDPNARIGFSAEGTFNRSDFGISQGVPKPGSTSGVSDEVKVRIEAEFTGPAWKDAPAEPPAPIK